MNDTIAPDHSRLFEIASEQGGYFTAQQALSCGFSRANLSHHAQSGRFRRVRHGLYRLKDYPSSPREDVIRAWLSVGKDTAVVSHQSALELLGLSDLVPDAVHLTVPRAARYRRRMPGVHVHTTTEPPTLSETVVVDGIRITSPARSIADAAAAGESPEHILAAARQALSRGMVTRDQLERVARGRGGSVEQIIRQAGEGKSGRLVPRWNLILPEAMLRGAEPDETPADQRGRGVKRALDRPPSPVYTTAGASHRSSARAHGAAVSEPARKSGKAPQVVVIGGPNGAGKTSSAPRLLRDTVGIEAFVNADLIAEGLSAFAPQASAIEAGRILLARLRQLAEHREDFAFESTLSRRTLHTFLRRVTDSGYESHIFYLWLPSADLAVGRVRRRVEAGGHDIPERVIRRRFEKSLVNFNRLYRPAATAWRLYDGSVIGRQRLIVHGKLGEEPAVVDPELWAVVRRQIEEGSR